VKFLKVRIKDIGPSYVTYTFELLNRQNLTSVVGKLSAEVTYLSSKNRLSCRFNGHFLAAQNMFCYLLRQKAALGTCSVQKFFETELCTDYCSLTGC
jgi:hypothetical protein